MHKPTFCGIALALSALASIALSGCDLHAQPLSAAKAPVTWVAAAATDASMAPKAPFDETPITPVESAGASRN